LPNASTLSKGTKNLSKREEKKLVSFLEREDFIQLMREMQKKILFLLYCRVQVPYPKVRKIRVSEKKRNFSFLEREDFIQ